MKVYRRRGTRIKRVCCCKQVNYMADNGARYTEGQLSLSSGGDLSTDLQISLSDKGKCISSIKACSRVAFSSETLNALASMVGLTPLMRAIRFSSSCNLSFAFAPRFSRFYVTELNYSRRLTSRKTLHVLQFYNLRSLALFCNPMISTFLCFIILSSYQFCNFLILYEINQHGRYLKGLLIIFAYIVR